MNPRPVIAVVEDDELTRTWLREHLADAGYAVLEAGTGGEARALVEAQSPALMLLDLRLPDTDGVELMEQLLGIDRDLCIIIVTAYGEVETAVRAVKAGAYQFLQKPTDLDDLLITIEKGLETSRLRRRLEVLQEQQGWQFADVRLVGQSQAMQALAATVTKLGPAEAAAVLLRGESGVGKDLVAKAIHAESARRDHPFIQINCTALPEHLVESELFGHERGAFTDARERKKGFAEVADGGTLFLDEIGDMPLTAQAKLLRFLEESKFQRVGGTTDVVVDVRVIAATNRDLEAAIAAHTFRSDLYYRLNVVPVFIPPLRERAEDVVPLAQHFVEHLALELKQRPRILSDETLAVLESYSWPGNVRELRNVIERTLILEDAPEIRPEHLPAEIAHPAILPERSTTFTLPSEGVTLSTVEADLIRQALARTDGNVTRAAALLGLTRDTLRYRIDKHDLAQ